MDAPSSSATATTVESLATAVLVAAAVLVTVVMDCEKKPRQIVVFENNRGLKMVVF